MSERLIDRVRIASPCPASWEGMRGDDRVRFCKECQLSVHNLSDMSLEEAEAFLRQREGRTCVRLYRRADGTVLTNDCPVGLRAIRRAARRSLALAGSFLAALLLFVMGGTLMLEQGRSSRTRNNSSILFAPFARLIDVLFPPPPMTGVIACQIGRGALPTDDAIVTPPTEAPPYIEVDRAVVELRPRR